MYALGRLVALSLAFLVGAADAAPDLLSIARVNGPTRPGGYIVSLKPAALARRAHRALLRSFSPADAEVKYEWPALNAFAGTFSDSALLALRSSLDVAAIEPDAIGGADGTFVTQTDAPWGLQRISQLRGVNSTDYRALNYTYVYDSSAGQGVDIYIIDSGINIDHEDFEGRARWGTTFSGFSQQDEYGHGTHVAGIAAGKRFGVAKAANLVAVRILSKDGLATTSDAIAAVDWVVKEAAKTHVPSVINMSLRFPPSIVLDDAVTTAVKAGVHTTVSAGNAATLSDTQSPARAEAAITVGATDMLDKVAYFSNYGPGVDIFAPGQQIASALNNDITWYTLKSGTSQASPHVAGLVAYVIGLEGNKPTPEILARIKEWSPDGILTEMPADTNNELANNGARA